MKFELILHLYRLQSELSYNFKSKFLKFALPDSKNWTIMTVLIDDSANLLRIFFSLGGWAGSIEKFTWLIVIVKLQSSLTVQSKSVGLGVDFVLTTHQNLLEGRVLKT